MKTTQKNEKLSVVTDLIRRGVVKIDERYEGKTPLMFACENGHSQIAHALIEAGADVNASYPINGMTSLMWASQNGYLSIVQELLAHRADVNAKTTMNDDSRGSTAIMRASQHGYSAIVEELLRHDANPNAACINGATALMMASQYGHIEPVRQLLAHGANVNAELTTGETALMLACWKGHANILRELLAHGANVNAVSKVSGDSGLILATDHHHEEVVKVLCQSGVDQTIVNKDGKKAIDYADNAMKLILSDCTVEPVRAPRSIQTPIQPQPQTPSLPGAVEEETGNNVPLLRNGLRQRKGGSRRTRKTRRKSRR